MSDGANHNAFAGRRWMFDDWLAIAVFVDYLEYSMKLKAGLLMICLLAWFVETLATVKIICPEKASLPAKTCNTMSCSKRMHGEMQQQKCNGKPAEKNGKERGSCNDAASCLNCPLCFVSTLNCPVSIDRFEIIADKKYPSIQFSHVSGFTGNSWKPPDFPFA